jgi:hypothetical protein
MKTRSRLKRVAVAVAAMLLAAIGVVSCDTRDACAAPAPRPAPAPRVPSLSKPSAPRSSAGYRPGPSSHTGTIVPVVVPAEDDDDTQCSK